MKSKLDALVGVYETVSPVSVALVDVVVSSEVLDAELYPAILDVPPDCAIRVNFEDAEL